MAELFNKLGIDWKLLIAQLINFAILFWVLKRFAYQPILGVLEKRSKRIAQSLEDAKKIDTEMVALASEKERVVNEARTEAQKIIEGARADANSYLEKQREQAKADAAAVVKTAEAEARRAKDGIVAEATSELAALVVAAAEKVVRVKIDAPTDRKIVEDALKDRR